MQCDSSVAAIVTGGASGLGEAVARALSGLGVRVAIFDRDAQRGTGIATEIGGLFCPVDVTSEEEVDAGFASARAHHGQERILVNCAGIGSGEKTAWRDKKTGVIHHHSLQTFKKVIGVNLVGTFCCLAKSAAGMLTLPPDVMDGERGVIINTASVAAVEGQIGQVAYAASKGGILGLTLPVARDLMNDGIRVNTILPGLMRTPQLVALPDPVQNSLAASVPFPKRLGHPSEFADLVLGIIRNPYFNAAEIRLDGAIRMAPR